MSDGGRRIEGYIIQKKAKGTSTWLDCSPRVEGDINKGRAAELVENEWYQFRIIAFNSAGQSLPGEPSGLIQVNNSLINVFWWHLLIIL